MSRFPSSVVIVICVAMMSAAVTAAVEVVNATPTGVISPRTGIPIQITFSEPLTELGSTIPPDPAWFTIDPPMAGTWRWERPDVVTFDHTDPWPAAHEVRVVVALPEELGGAVFDWEFQIEGIQSIRLRECREQELELEFQLPPDIESLRDLITVSFEPDPRCRPAAMTPEIEAAIEAEEPGALEPYREMLASEPGPIPSLAIKEINPGARAGRRTGEVIDIATVVLAEQVPSFGRIEVTVAPGLVSIIGPGPSLRSLKAGCAARSPAVPTAVFSDDPANPLKALQFASGLPYSCSSRRYETRGSGFARAYKQVGDAWEEVELTRWNLSIPASALEPETLYELRLSPSFACTNTLPIGFPWRHRRRTGPAPGYLDMVGGHLVLELAAPRILPLKGRAVSTALLGTRELAPVDLAFLTDRFELAGRNRTEIPVEFPVVHNGTFDLDLRPLIADNEPGILALNLYTDVDPYQQTIGERWSTLQVTDLALTVLPFDDSGLLWVTRLSTGEPVAGATVNLVSPAGDLCLLGKSDEQGLLRLSSWMAAGSFLVAESGEDRAFVKIDDLNEHQFAFSSSSFQLPTHSIVKELDKDVADNFRTVAFTDRGLYRPGDTVHIRLITRIWRNLALETYQRNDGRPLETCLRLYAQETYRQLGDPICAEHSEIGTAAIDLPLPADLPPGTYRIDGATRAPLTIEVGEPRRPRLEAMIEAPPGPLLLGTGPTVALLARHATGLPLAELEVSSSVFSTPAEPTLPKLPPDLAASLRFSDDRGYRPGIYGRSAPRPIVTSTVTDDDGQALLSLPDDPSTTPLATVVNATVKDRDGQTITAHATLEVLPGTRLIGISDLPAVIDEGQELTVELLVVDPQGSPVPGEEIELTVGASDWVSVLVRAAGDQFETKSRERISRRGSMTLTSSTQPLVVVLEPEKGGHVTVTAEVIDSAGRASRISTSTTSEGPRPTRYRRDLGHEVELAVNEKVYRPGDVARVAIRSPWNPATALVVVRGANPRVVGVTRVEQTTTVVDVPLLATDIPDAVVQVVLVRGRSGTFPHYDLGTSWRIINVPDPGRPDVALGVARVIVDPTDRRLAVTVQTPLEPLRPGQEAQVEVVVARPDGSPAAGAEVTVWAVDEGHLALTAYQTPDPLATIYAPRALGGLLRVFDSRRQHLARRLSDKKSWLPGSDGGLAPEVPVRANFEPVAVWRGAMVADHEGRVGITFPVPDNLTTYRVMAVAVDGVAHFGAGQNSLVVSQPLVVDPILPRFLRPGDTSLVCALVYYLGNGEPEPVETRLEAGPSEVLLATVDRSRVELDSSNRGTARFGLNGAGPGVGEVTIRAVMRDSPDVADAVRSKIEVRSPPAAITQIAVLHTESKPEVQITPPPDPISGGLEVEIGGPQAGLSEVLTQSFVTPFVRPLYAALTARLDTDFEVSELLERRTLQTLLAHLERTRRKGRPNIEAEVQLLWLAGRLSRLDRPVPSPITDTLAPQMAAWLRRWQPESASLSTAALAALALAELGSTQSAVLQRLVDNCDSAAPGVSWLVALALHASDPDDPRIPQVVASAEGSLIRDSSGMVAVNPDRGDIGSALVTAQAIEMLTSLDPKDERLHELGDWLLAHRRQGRWGSGLSDPWCLWVLVDRLSRERGTGVPYRLQLGEVTIDEDTAGDGRSRVVTVDHQTLASLCTPSCRLRLDSDGGTLTATARLSWTPSDPAAASPGPFRVTRRIAELESSPGQGCAGPEPCHLALGQSARLCASVVGTRTLPSPSPLFIDIPLAAGLEVLESRVATSPAAEAAVQDRSEAVQHGRFGIRWGIDPPQVETHRVLLRAPTWAWKNETELEYCLAVRAVVPGDFLLPPAVAWAENSPELPSASASTRLVIDAPDPVP